ncbi:MAG: UDP-2,4-diacetamido-2,4,6-trideoxy-beta-L-altropyranose hydrolase [Firmicutes bacterium]|nr:UDP-2,4-diacetamido-2,4,6-trideoxy-beta-L-altropyranose hydrolase [Bacillota bacterium]
MDTDVLIIIPARGGSKGIPRKNLRILAGHPLIWYVIQTSKKASCHIVVTTEDEEIAEVAETYGAQVIARPKALAEDDIPLDPVILHAWAQSERKWQTIFNWVITIQPTSPLISTKTIKDALAYAQTKNLDSCLAVSDARALYWGGSTSAPYPHFQERLNRQWLPAFWKETGGIVISNRKLLLQGQRIGGKTGLYPIPNQESIDIDSYDDLVVAEHRIQAPKVAIRTIGNQQLGLGHVYRTLTLASRLFTPHLDFYVDSSSSLAAQLIKDHNYPVYNVTNDNNFIAIIESKGYDLIINDILDTNSEYITRLRQNNKRVVVNFEDLGSGATEANLVINALYEYTTPLPNQKFGWQYVCLREEFLRAYYEPKANPQAKNLLITFGGADPGNLTCLALQAAAEALGNCNAELDVVIGLGNPRIQEISTLVDQVSKCFSDLRLHTHVKRMSSLMHRADLAITSNGRTVFELASCGVPMISISQNYREASHTFGRLNGGVIDLGLAEHVTIAQLAQNIRDVWLAPEKRLQMQASLLMFDFRKGVDRVIRCIKETYLDWRNQHYDFSTTL